MGEGATCSVGQLWISNTNVRPCRFTLYLKHRRNFRGSKPTHFLKTSVSSCNVWNPQFSERTRFYQDFIFYFKIIVAYELVIKQYYFPKMTVMRNAKDLISEHGKIGLITFPRIIASELLHAFHQFWGEEKFGLPVFRSKLRPWSETIHFDTEYGTWIWPSRSN